jgi:hypothetical protein
LTAPEQNGAAKSGRHSALLVLAGKAAEGAGRHSTKLLPAVGRAETDPPARSPSGRQMPRISRRSPGAP